MNPIRPVAITALTCVLLGQTASAAGLPPGAYECWGNGEARLLMNFTVTGPNAYKGSDNSMGNFSVTGGGNVNFLSGSLNGVMPHGFVSKYEVRKGVPTVSFVGPSGAEAQYCEHVK